MSIRIVVFIATGLVATARASAQEHERVRVRDRSSAPRVWINGEEVSPLDWVTKRKARIGVSLDMRATENDSVGATIASVTPGGPAAKAGFQSGDIITRFNGQRLTKAERDRDEDEDQSIAALRLLELVSKLEPGDTVAIEYRRGKETKTANVVTAAERGFAFNRMGEGGLTFEGRAPRIAGNVRSMNLPKTLMRTEGPDGFAFDFGGPFADLELAPLNADLGSYFGTSDGVLVIDAPEKNLFGLKGGDVILSVDGRKARGPSSFFRILRSYDTGDVVKLEIMRNKARQSLTAKIDRREED